MSFSRMLTHLQPPSNAACTTCATGRAAWERSVISRIGGFGSGLATDQTELRTGRLRPFKLWNTPGKMGIPACLDRIAERAGHADRVQRLGDSCGEQDAVAAQVHRNRSVAGRTEARVAKRIF